MSSAVCWMTIHFAPFLVGDVCLFRGGGELVRQAASKVMNARRLILRNRKVSFTCGMRTFLPEIYVGGKVAR